MLKITQSVESFIIQHFSDHTDTEECCFWGSSISIDTIDCIFAVESQSASRYMVIPNIDFLNKKLSEWRSNRISCVGFIHSHITDNPTLSEFDLEAAKAIYNSLSLDNIYLGLILLNSHYTNRIIVYTAQMNNNRFDVKPVSYKTVIDKCPRCGGTLILRTAKHGINKGNSFYGCSNYPKCRYIKNL